MPRRPRIHLNDVPLHIVQRGHNREPCLIIALGRRYVQYINQAYRRTGTLWDNRYKSSLIQAETGKVGVVESEPSPFFMSYS